METLFSVIIGVGLFLIFTYLVAKREFENEQAIERNRDAHIDKQIAFFEKVPEGKCFVFVDVHTFNILIINSKSYLPASEAPADLRCLYPGVIGYMYGYGIIVDEELAGTYL